ncbi:unnamed protein product, partial [Rhizoctonia solani]
MDADQANPTAGSCFPTPPTRSCKGGLWNRGFAYASCAMRVGHSAHGRAFRRHAHISWRVLQHSVPTQCPFPMARRLSPHVRLACVMLLCGPPCGRVAQASQCV